MNFSVIGMQNWLWPIIWAIWVHWGPGAPASSGFVRSGAWFSLSQRCRHNLWGKPQNISERSGWIGGGICRYFSTRNSCDNKTFMKINTSATWFTFLILSGRYFWKFATTKLGDTIEMYRLFGIFGICGIDWWWIINISEKIDLKSYKIMDWKDPDGELLRLLTQLSVGSQFLEF